MKQMMTEYAGQTELPRVCCADQKGVEMQKPYAQAQSKATQRAFERLPNSTSPGETIKSSSLILLSLLILLGLSVASLYLGRYPVSLSSLVAYLFSGEYRDSNLPIVLLNIRLPRILGAVGVGGALAISGAAYQGMFRNPMVSPDILGVSSGAGFGAAFGILLSLPIMGIQASSFVGGISAVLIAVSISKTLGRRHDSILVLVLSGIIISSLFGALLSLLKYVADPDDKLPAITYWLMGSLANIRLADLWVIFPVLLLGTVPLMLVSWRLNVLSFGEDEARSLGINTAKMRALVMVCATLVTASVISFSGIIGWIGLLIPHLARFVAGPNHRWLLPTSFLFGAIFMLLVDNVARSVASVEIPIGIITSLVGAPFFIYFLKNSSKQSW
ncbi:transport system permease protein [Chloroherpeton thalassium ATCC 35110]|uniref:Transport system permease protein n=1 Tax=Chloroherpeton thalassium (strain ATCC 35110 / GB-78) TaxID=517418 RepID=B3QXE5_CHLT3|nr:iron ABC transporter permease [Chloroherpeton thalassium]ACF13419.1 transport system permease protein [Chloroherpeton thalassium ATCC 35110]